MILSKCWMLWTSALAGFTPPLTAWVVSVSLARVGSEVQELWGSLSLSFSLFLSLTHTHTHSLSYMLSVSTVILLHGYSMYIKHCCSVGSFGAKLICILDKFVLFKYINLLILCLSLDLPDVITSICAGQLWTIGQIELLAKTWVLQIAPSLWLAPPLDWPHPFPWLLP